MKFNPMENKIFAKIANIFATVVLICAILICILVIASMKSSTGMAQIFGYSLLSVQSDSMEPIFYEGDLIVVQCTDKDMTFQKDDIITFSAYDDYGVKFLNTHRIVEVRESSVRNSYVTKGDNSDKVDSRKVYQNAVLGKYTGHKVPGLGTVLDFVSSATGVLLCVVLPSALIIAWQIVEYVKNSARKKKEFLAQVAEQAQANSGKFVEEYLSAQGATAARYAPAPVSPELAEFERQQIINDYIRAQKEEEAKKQAIIEEYLAKQREAEEAAKADAEAAKIKAIISEFLAQQKAAAGEAVTADTSSEVDDKSDTDNSDTEESDSTGETKQS